MTDIDIRGIFNTSLIDYPGKIVSTIFFNRCNFRCPFCHNPELVLDKDKNDPIDPDTIIEYLEKRKKWLDGVCLTGGEPTLHKGLEKFIKNIKERGFLVKLDTNGTNPSILETLIKKELVDYMHRTRTPLLKWFWAIFLFSNDKRGISAMQLSNKLDVSYWVAWTMLHKIRKAMRDRDARYKLAGLIEVDDSYVGGSSNGGGKRGRGTRKIPVLIAASTYGEAIGFAKMQVVDSLHWEPVKSFLQEGIRPKQTRPLIRLNRRDSVFSRSSNGSFRFWWSPSKCKASRAHPAGSYRTRPWCMKGMVLLSMYNWAVKPMPSVRCT